MIIKLQPDQVTLFWDMIRASMIASNDVPRKYQQDYSINILTKFLSGKLQAWIGYKIDKEGNKLIHVLLVSSIIDEKHYGVKALNAEAVYGFRPLDEELINEIYLKMVEFAKANKCNVMTADYSIDRVKEILLNVGFEKHRTICKKFL